jgi:hypothetical protein
MKLFYYLTCKCKQVTHLCAGSLSLTIEAQAHSRYANQLRQLSVTLTFELGQQNMHESQHFQYYILICHMHSLLSLCYFSRYINSYIYREAFFLFTVRKVFHNSTIVRKSLQKQSVSTLSE